MTGSENPRVPGNGHEPPPVPSARVSRRRNLRALSVWLVIIGLAMFAGWLLGRHHWKNRDHKGVFVRGPSFHGVDLFGKPAALFAFDFLGTHVDEQVAELEILVQRIEDGEVHPLAKGWIGKLDRESTDFQGRVYIARLEMPLPDNGRNVTRYSFGAEENTHGHAGFRELDFWIDTSTEFDWGAMSWIGERTAIEVGKPLLFFQQHWERRDRPPAPHPREREPTEAEIKAGIMLPGHDDISWDLDELARISREHGNIIIVVTARLRTYAEKHEAFEKQLGI